MPKAPAKSTSATKVPRVYFIAGSDESAVKREAKARAAELAGDAGDFGLETIDGAVGTVDEAASRIADTIQGLLTMPFFGGTKLVWLKNPSFLADNQMGRSETTAAGLEKLLEVLKQGLPEGMSFLLSAAEIDRRKAFYKNFSKLAEVREYDMPSFGFNATEEDVIAWVVRQAREQGVELEAEAAATLAARVGAEPRQLTVELEKLVTAYGVGTRIQVDQVRELVPATREGGIFDLSNAVAARDLPLALSTLDQLTRQGERGIGLLLAAIVPTVRNLFLVKELMETHRLRAPAHAGAFSGILARLPEHAIRHLPRKKDGSLNAYPLGIAALNCRRYTLDELHAGFLGCRRVNTELISSSLTDHLVLARYLVGLLGKAD